VLTLFWLEFEEWPLCVVNSCRPNYSKLPKTRKPQIFRLEALYLSVAGTREMSNFLEDVQAVANWR